MELLAVRGERNIAGVNFLPPLQYEAAWVSTIFSTSPEMPCHRAIRPKKCHIPLTFEESCGVTQK
jgi:hypothetical protein